MPEQPVEQPLVAQPQVEREYPFIGGEHILGGLPEGQPIVEKKRKIFQPDGGWTSTTLRKMARPDIVATLADAAARNKLRDRDLLAAVHLAEDGQDGMEFGYGVERTDPKNPRSPLRVRKERWKGFDAQAGGAADQIELVAKLYEENFKGKQAFDGKRFTEDFIRYFSGGGPGYRGYASKKADNDPDGKNKNHIPNILDKYNQIKEEGFDWDDPIDDTDVPLSFKADDKQFFNEYQELTDMYRLKQSTGLIDETTKPFHIMDWLEAVLKWDEEGRSQFYETLADSGLSHVKLDPDLIPQRMDGETFLKLVFDIDPVTLEKNPFTYDPEKGIGPQVIEWVKGLDESIRKGNQALAQMSVEDASGPLGGIFILGSLTSDAIRLLKKLGTLPKTLKKKRVKELDKVKKLIAIQQERQRKIQEIVEKQAERLEANTPQVPLDQRAEQVAGNDVWTLQKLKDELHLPNNPISDIAARMRLTRANQEIDEILIPLMDVYEAEPTQQNLFKFFEAWAEFLENDAKFITGVSASARTTGAQSKAFEQGAKSRIEAFNELIIQGATTPGQLIHNLKNIKSLPEFIAFGNKVSKKGAWKTYNAALVGGMLSASTTWLGMNVVGNLANMAWWLGKHQLAGLTPGTPVKAHETYDAIKAMQAAFESEWKLFKRNLDKPEVRYGKTKLEVLDIEENFSVFSAADLPLPSMMDSWRPAIDKMAHWAQFFIRVAIAQDELTKGLVYNGKLSMEAQKYVTKLDGFDLLGAKEKRELYQTTLRQMHLTPNKFPLETRSSRHLGSEITLTNTLSDAGEALIKLSNSHPGVKMFMLFMRTPWNGIVKTGKDFPIIGTLRDAWNGKLFSKDPYVRADAIAQATLSNSIGVGAWMLAESTFYTGAGHPDPQVRAAMYDKGWRPHSLQFDTDGDGTPDWYLQLPMGVPMFNILYIMDGIQKSWGFMSNDEQVLAKDMIFLTISEYAEEHPFLRVVADISAIREAAASGMPEEQFKKWAADRGMTYLFPPLSALTNQVKKIVDPTRRDVGGSLGELNTWWNIFKNRFPGASKTLMPSIDAYGGTQEWSGGWGPVFMDNNVFGRTLEALTPGLTAFKSSTINEDPRIARQLQYLSEQGAPLRNPPTSFEGVELNWNQQQVMKLVAGLGRIPSGYEYWGIHPTGKLLDKTMVEALEEEMLNPNNERVDNGDGTFRLSKVDLIKAAYSKQYEQAYEILKTTPLFANIAEEIQLREELQPLKHQADDINRPSGINMKKIYDLFN